MYSNSLQVKFCHRFQQDLERHPATFNMYTFYHLFIALELLQ